MSDYCQNHHNWGNCVSTNLIIMAIPISSIMFLSHVPVFISIYKAIPGKTLGSRAFMIISLVDWLIRL